MIDQRITHRDTLNDLNALEPAYTPAGSGEVSTSSMRSVMATTTSSNAIEVHQRRVANGMPRPRMAMALTLSVRGELGESTMTLSWLEPQRWQALLAEAGFEVVACYGWFDRRPFTAAKTRSGSHARNDVANCGNFVSTSPCSARGRCITFSLAASTGARLGREHDRAVLRGGATPRRKAGRASWTRKRNRLAELAVRQSATHFAGGAEARATRAPSRPRRERRPPPYAEAYPQERCFAGSARRARSSRPGRHSATRPRPG